MLDADNRLDVERSIITGRWSARFPTDEGAVERIELAPEAVTGEEAMRAFYALKRQLTAAGRPTRHPDVVVEDVTRSPECAAEVERRRR